MAIEFIGKTVTLSSEESKTLLLSYSRDTKIVEIMSNSTGRVTLTSLRIAGVEEYITGVLELDLFKKHGNIYVLPEPIPYPKEAKIEVGLTDISGDKNIVYIAFVMTY